MHWNIDRFAAIEGYGGNILVEEGFKHDHFISLFKEGSKDRVLSYTENLLDTVLHIYVWVC